jgi:uncharacterized protein
MSLRPALLACLATLCVSLSSQAADPPASKAEPTAEQKAAIDDLFEVMNLRAQHKQMAEALALSMRQTMSQQSLPLLEKMPAHKRERASALLKERDEGFIQSLTDVYTDSKTQAQLVALMAEAYLKVFTLEELRAMSAFYRTPTGHKVLVESPRLMSEVMPGMQALILPRLLKLNQENSARFSEKLKQLNEEK